jgi:hypothetical protein
MNTATRPRKPATLPLVFVADRFLGLKRNATYSAVAKSGELIPGVPVLRIGGHKLVVPVAALERALGIDVMDHLTDDELAGETDSTSTR